MLERERLEARRVYNSCLENEDSGGVNYDHSTVWRVIKDVRIDLGAVSGRYVARESPNFVDGPTRMRHDAPGVVSYFCNENKPLRKILLDRTGVL
ncbi:hypothetical protein ACHAXA_006875 [Cyclostephanos tholiformis]|uniref:Uncharacterized protein n=1 Tax=Cyclostephanos tholiformis TaxID=382380 RepID=A0ABD3SDB0_9STRA